MSNNKQSRIYQCVELLNKGVNDLGVQTTIINAYEKVVRKNDALKEHTEKLVLDLQDKKETISNLEEEIKQISEENIELVEKVKRLKTIASALTNSKLKDTQEENLEKCYEALTIANKENLILRREKNELEDAVNSLLNRDMLQENEILKETNKNLLNIGKDMEVELNRYKEKYSKLKAKVNTIYGNSLVLGDISLEEASNLRKDNEKLNKEIYSIKDLNFVLINDKNLLEEENNKLKTLINTIYSDSIVLGNTRLEKISDLVKENEKLKSNLLNNEEAFRIATREIVAENEKLKQKVKDLDMKILTESLNKASWHNTYEADIQALKSNLQCTDDMNKILNESLRRLMKTYYPHL